MSTPASRLRGRWDELLQRLERFGRVRGEDVSDVAEMLRDAMSEYQARADAARDRSAERSDRVRGRIRAAWGCLPFIGSEADWLRALQRRMQGRGWTADPRTMRAELRIMHSEAEMQHSAGTRGHAASIPST